MLLSTIIVHAVIQIALRTEILIFYLLNHDATFGSELQKNKGVELKCCSNGGHLLNRRLIIKLSMLHPCVSMQQLKSCVHCIV